MLETQYLGLLVWGALLAIAVFGYVTSARAAEKLDRDRRTYQTPRDTAFPGSPSRGF